MRYLKIRSETGEVLGDFYTDYGHVAVGCRVYFGAFTPRIARNVQKELKS